MLQEWELLCSLFDGDVVSGPVPTLFSERPDAARAALEADPEKASQDLSRVLRKFVIPENVPPAAAWGVLLKPREAEVLQPFKRALYVAPSADKAGPAPKKARTGPVTSETGNTEVYIERLSKGGLAMP